MIMKIVISPEDKMIQVYEIARYYTESGNYLEVIAGKDVKGLNEIVLDGEGKYFDENTPEGDEFWKELTIMSDAGFELLKIENLDWELVKNGDK